jgi:hypothetical protein
MPYHEQGQLRTPSMNMEIGVHSRDIVEEEVVEEEPQP